MHKILQLEKRVLLKRAWMVFFKQIALCALLRYLGEYLADFKLHKRTTQNILKKTSQSGLQSALKTKGGRRREVLKQVEVEKQRSQGKDVISKQTKGIQECQVPTKMLQSKQGKN